MKNNPKSLMTTNDHDNDDNVHKKISPKILWNGKYYVFLQSKENQ